MSAADIQLNARIRRNKRSNKYRQKTRLPPTTIGQIVGLSGSVGSTAVDWSDLGLYGSVQSHKPDNNDDALDCKSALKPKTRRKLPNITKSELVKSP